MVFREKPKDVRSKLCTDIAAHEARELKYKSLIGMGYVVEPGRQIRHDHLASAPETNQVGNHRANMPSVRTVD
jgi:hypothetical protein